MGTRSHSRKGYSPQFSAHICCGQMDRWIKMPLGRKIGLDPSDIVLDGDPAPPLQKSGRAHPNFRPCLLCPNGWMDQHALGVDVGHGPGHIVLDGNLLPFPEKGAQPPFSAHVCCGQTAGWIKMPLGMEPRPRPHFARWGPSSPSPQKGAQPPIFGPCLLCPNGWMDRHALGMEGGHCPGHIVLDGNLLPFPEKGA